MNESKALYITMWASAIVVIILFAASEWQRAVAVYLTVATAVFFLVQVSHDSVDKAREDKRMRVLSDSMFGLVVIAMMAGLALIWPVFLIPGWVTQ